MASSLLKYSLFEHGLLELTTASQEIWLLHDSLEGAGEEWKCFFVCAQQCRNLYIMNLPLEFVSCIWLNFCFVPLKFVVSVQAPRTRAVKNVRRHACSSIIKMCRDYPQLVLVCKLQLS